MLEFDKSSFTAESKTSFISRYIYRPETPQELLVELMDGEFYLPTHEPEWLAQALEDVFLENDKRFKSGD